MKLRKPDSSVQRVVIAIGAGAAMVAFVGWVFFLGGSSYSGEKINGLRIVAAAQAYTRTLQANKQPIPQSVRVDELVTRGFLRPEEVAAFRGLDATVLLTGIDAGPKTILMRVHFQDGTDLALLADGSVQSVPK